MCQWDKDSCADAGFLKIDLLGPGDALGGRALRGGDRAHARRARSTSRASPSTTPATYDGDPGGRHDGRLPDREPRADAVAAAHAARRTSTTSRSRSRSCGPGPILGGAVNPYIERRQRLREDPDYVVPYEHPSLEPVLRDTLGHDHLPGPGDRGRDGVRRLLAGRGRGAAPGDEPQALGGGDRGLPPALRRRRARARTASTRRSPSASTTMIVGFSGFGFPKAHGAAFGLLAYQSTWLRVHYGPEFLCALLNEQPMGFYAAGHARPRGPAARASSCSPPDVNASDGRAARSSAPTARGAALGPAATCCGVPRRDEVGGARRPPRAATGGPFALARRTSPSRAGAGRPALEQLAWAGACDALATRRAAAAGRAARGAVAARRRRARRAARGGHAARAAARRCPDAPALRALERVGGDGRRLRDDRADARRRTRWRCCAPSCRARAR